MFSDLLTYLQYPFVRYALIVGVLIALCSSLFGVTLVLKRLSFIGDGLSHVAFGAIAIASVMNLSNNMFLVLPVTVICAVILLAAGRRARLKGDAAIAMISVSALALGYLVMNIFSTSTNLAGDVAIFVMLYHKIFAVTFDEDFARTSGTNAGLYNVIIAVITATIIVLAMNLVGSLLISALVIFPALSAMRVFKSFLKVTICSAVLSVICTLAGMLISIVAGTPVGSTIVAADIVR